MYHLKYLQAQPTNAPKIGRSFIKKKYNFKKLEMLFLCFCSLNLYLK